MNRFTRISDPINPKPGEITDVAATTVRGILKEIYGADFTEFDRPTIVLVGEEPVMRGAWDDELADGDVVVEMPVVTGILEIILIALVVAAVVAAVVIAATLKKPAVPGGAGESALSVYSLSGQRNRNKLGNPIEVPYGRCRLWPSYAAPSYGVYVDNNQFLFLLLCLGQGSYDIESIKIENTEIASYPEIEYAVVEPNGTIPGWIYTHTHTVREVNSLELLAPNDADYPGGRIDNGVTVPDDLPGAAGWIGPFTISPAKVNAASVALDITFPNGLYVQIESTLYPNSALAQFEYRPTSAISGGPESGWLALGVFDYTSVLVTGQPLNSPLRFTLNFALPAEGEYQVRCRRATRKQDSSTAQSTMVWEGMRSYLLPNQTTFGDVTLLAVKIRATNSLNGDVSDRINVVATRKLPTYDTETEEWDDTVEGRTATRSIVMAYCDVLRNKTYGCGIDDEFVDMPALLTIQTHHEEIDYFFDYVFDQRRSAWEALGVIAKSGRCLPTLNGSLVSLVLDQLTEFPLHVFTPDNIIRGTFQWQLKIANYQENDGLLVTYVDEDTFNQETLLCCAPDEEGNNPDTVTLDGMTNRAQAWHEGLYLRYVTRYMRQNIVFSTGLEGYIPTMGDMIGVVFDVPSWGQSGKVLDAEAVDGGADPDYTLVVLSNELDFSVVAVDAPLDISFRTGSSGTPTTPYSVVWVEDDGPRVYRVTPQIDPVNFNLDGDRERTIYAAGKPNEQFVLAKITAVNNSDEDTVQITAAVYDEKVFDGDLIPPPEPEIPPVEDAYVTIELRTVAPDVESTGPCYDQYIVYSVNDTSLCSGNSFFATPPGTLDGGPNPRPGETVDEETYWPYPFVDTFDGGVDGNVLYRDTINETRMRAALGLGGAPFSPLKFIIQTRRLPNINPGLAATPVDVKITHTDGRVLEFTIPEILVGTPGDSPDSPWDAVAGVHEIRIPATGAGDISQVPRDDIIAYDEYPRPGWEGYIT